MKRMTIALGALALAGCNTGTLPDAEDVSAERGAALFATDCAACHGADATGGTGPDLTTLSARNGGVFPWEAALTQIDGLGRHGQAEAVMPEFGALGLGPTVVVERDGLGVPVPVDLLALVTFLEGVQR
ncbi:c-type cytochrome [Jannaschia aquimarina]|uniref:Cytochrome c n=1 Tax=Jannaschia aquimarina TaxID=935700 RepID=A0A0D1EJP7_9RHOB|nr:c-type cytochrome [Jannaschia aquimarina]KIT17216.1 Cytochrome c [Jannaschia aquimarina]SNT18571.1 Cytochrome C oxidase, cbb3-type, subunit III [Jannaschia aquimarina]